MHEIAPSCRAIASRPWREEPSSRAALSSSPAARRGAAPSLSGSHRPRAFSVALLAAATLACRSSIPAAPPPAWLPSVPDGYGRPWDARAVLSVQEGHLKLPSGQTCLPDEPECSRALQMLRGERLALELDGSRIVAELSAPLAALSLALPAERTACLAVADTKGRRCVPFRPFSSDDFGAWLDADQPPAKIRVILRADGMEVAIDRGKIPGPDRHGPSLPSLGARPDYQGLDADAAKLKARFPSETEAGLAASPSIPVAQAARILAILSGPGGERFERTFLVYP